MKKIIINSLMIIIILTTLSAFASAESWWNNDWDYRNEITISANKISEDLTDFPVLVYLESGMNADFNNIETDGKDLRFVFNGTTLDYEIEKINSNQSWIWVKLPYVSSLEDTIFHVYYGNPNSTDGQNVHGVWNDDFLTVQHLEEDPSSTILDSTSNGYIGNPYGMDYSNQVSSIIGNGISFDGNSESIDFPGPIDPDNYNEGFSVSMWFNPSVSNKPQELIDWMEDGGWGGSRIGLQNDGRLFYRFATGSSAQAHHDLGSYFPNQWLNVVITHNTSVDRMYLDGVLIHEAASGTKALDKPYFSIGSNTIHTAQYMLNGKIDELRILSKDLTPGEVSTYYNSDMKTLLDFGPATQELPDLAITDVVYWPTNPQANELIQLNVTISNLGFTPVNSFDWVYNFDYGNNLASSVLNSGDEVVVTLEHNYSYGGDYTFYFEVDPLDNLTEISEANNIHLENIFVNGTVDLVPSIVSLNRNIGTTNGSNSTDPREVIFTVRVDNTGNMYIEGVSYNMDFGDNTGYGTLISERINAENFILINISHAYSDFGTYDVKFEIDNLSLIEETNESNNIAEKTSYVERLFVEGALIIGNTVKIHLFDWNNPFRQYALLASMNNNHGINMSDGRVIPLNRDPLFNKMQHNSTDLGFVNANSTLDSNGEAIVTWNIPNETRYEGKNFYAAFVTYNGSMSKPGAIYSISSAIPMGL